MNDILKDLVGKHVEVRSRAGDGGFRDEGRLVDYDERWIKLDKGAGEVLYFPIANVRLVKPLS
ncbi:hypothetical protein EON83_03045 [bacterium]|nr:MAG: hypothetical protein EON83_03045 [bacterium]